MTTIKRLKVSFVDKDTMEGSQSIHGKFAD